jgi:Uma2 family endonuclease
LNLKIPFDEYAAHDESRMFEWIDGELELLSPLSDEQQRVKSLLLDWIGDYVELYNIGLFIPAPFAVRMPEEMRRGREPDLLFVPNQFVETVQENYVNSHGVALVIEISDWRSRALDEGDKFNDYELAGIPEFWIVDVDQKEARFFRHTGVCYQTIRETQPYESLALGGLKIDPSRLWK